MTQDKKTAARPLPPEVLERVYEQWVTVDHEEKIVALKHHKDMAERVGWWFSGKRGYGLTMERLEPDLIDLFRERDEAR